MGWSDTTGRAIGVGLIQLGNSSVLEESDAIMRSGIAAGSYVVAAALPLQDIKILGGSKEERALTDILAASLVQATANRFILESERSFLADTMVSLSSQVLGVYAYDIFMESDKQRKKSPSARAVLD